MASLVVHFEIHASEPQRLIDFYSSLLGWEFSRFGDMDYWAITTGEGSIQMGSAGNGINGDCPLPSLAALFDAAFA